MITEAGETTVSTQKTLKSAIHCTGVGLHTGSKVRLTLKPGPVNGGITFLRTDLPEGQRLVRASWDSVVETTLNTSIGNAQGTVIRTVEHLMAALAGCSIDNAVIELDGPEVPIMDGSAAPFVFLIECAGIAAQAASRRGIRVLKTVTVGDQSCSASLSPGAGSSFSFEIDFASRAVARQRGYIRLANGAFKTDLARARTFGFAHEVEALRARGLARGGSLENAIVVQEDRILNEEGLRYEDEFVRHKILDSIGDLYLAGAPILGHFHGRRSGHALNNELLHALFGDDSAWCFDAVESIDTLRGGWEAGTLARSA